MEYRAVDGPVVGEASYGTFESEFGGGLHGVGGRVWTAEDVHSVRGVSLSGMGGAKVDPPVVIYDV